MNAIRLAPLAALILCAPAFRQDAEGELKKETVFNSLHRKMIPNLAWASDPVCGVEETADPKDPAKKFVACFIEYALDLDGEPCAQLRLELENEMKAARMDPDKPAFSADFARVAAKVVFPAHLEALAKTQFAELRKRLGADLPELRVGGRVSFTFRKSKWFLAGYTGDMHFFEH